MGNTKVSSTKSLVDGKAMEPLAFPSAVEFYKYRRKTTIFWLCLYFFYANYLTLAEELHKCNNLTQTCIAEPERAELGDPRLYGLGQLLPSLLEAPKCRGKVLLSNPTGFLTDGPGNYSLDYKCTWVLQSSYPNATIT